MAWEKKVWVDNQTPLCAENMNHLEDGIDSKVDKVEKTDKWQLYGIGDKNVDLPNNGKTINAESKAVAHTVINRNGYGRAEINNPVNDLDIANKQYVDIAFNNITTKVVQNNGIAKYIEKNTDYNVNGAFARAFSHNENIYILANNTFYLYSKDTLELTVLKNNFISQTLDPNTIERVNEQPVEIHNTNSFLCAYRVKKSNGYEIRLRQFDYNGNNIGDYFTVATSTSFGLYEPFIIMVSATTGYIYYSKENNSVNQDIAMKKFTITNNTISVGGENIVVSGTNQKSDNGKVVANSRPGFSVITHLLDGTYLMLIESNVNVNQTDNPYVIQYVYIKDLNDPKTYTAPKTLLKSNKQIINIPYITTTSDGRIAISYHSTENYYGELGDGIGIHKKTFNAIISKNKIGYGQELNAYDFGMIPTLATTKNQWSGGWGSITFIDKIYLLYVYGSNTATTSTQTNFSISTIGTVDNILTKHDASVEVKNNSIMKRSSKGFSYTATPVNLDPTQQPTLTVNKAYVANYVSKITADLDSAWLYETHLNEEIWTQLQTNGQISFDNYQSLADYLIKPLLNRVNTPIIRIFCGDSKYIFHYQGYMTYEKGNVYNFLSIINDDKQNPLFLILSVDYVQQLIKLNTFDPNTFTRKYQHTILLKYRDELICYYIFEDTTATKYETIEALIKARGWVNDEFNPNIFTLHENTIVGNGLMVHNNTDLVVSLNGHLIQNFDSITDTIK